MLKANANKNKTPDLSIKKIDTKDTKKYPPMPKPLPQFPFRLLLLGSSAGGKTTLLLNILTNENFYKGVFDKIYIISPTISVDSTWQALDKLPEKEKEKYRFFEQCNVEDIQAILDEQDKAIKASADKSKPLALLVFDDCIGSKFLTSKTFGELFYKGRHYNCNTILSFQSYKNVQRSIRLNFSHTIVTSITENELVMISPDLANPVFSKKMVQDLYHSCKSKNKYNFLYKDGTEDYADQFMMNFTTIFKIKKKPKV
jgi:hypothetical protein